VTSVGKQLPPVTVERRFRRGSEPIRLLEARAEEPRLAARGDQLFGNLFASAYGPAAYTSFLKQRREQPAPVFGVKDEDITRMDNYLMGLADIDRTQRTALGVVGVSMGGILASTAVLGAAGVLEDPRMNRASVIGTAALGAAFVGGGLYLSLTSSAGEEAYQAFQSELRAQRGNRALAFARTEEKLREVARIERSRRRFTFWTMQGLALTIASGATLSAATDDESRPGVYALLYGTAALTSGLGFYVLGVETATERMLRLYREDPGVKLRAGVAAFPNGGLGLGVSGTF